MKKPAKGLWLQDGWNWIDRVFFYPAAAIALATALGYLLWLFRPASWGPEAWSAAASWIQAVGSIAAIFFGFIMVRFQLSEQRREATERADEAERAQVSRGFQILQARVVIAQRYILNLEKFFAQPQLNWHIHREICLALDRVFTAPHDPSFNPAILTAVSALQARSRTLTVVADLCMNDPAARTEDAIKSVRDGVAAFKAELDWATRWIRIELAATLSARDRAQMERAAMPH